jgi:hypothetical protein
MRKVEGFREVKTRVLRALSEGSYFHEQRGEIDVNNWLETGRIKPEEVAAVISRCNGTHHSCSPHHGENRWLVHVLKRDGWYIKFYFVDPSTIFISVHR